MHFSCSLSLALLFLYKILFLLSCNMFSVLAFVLPATSLPKLVSDAITVAVGEEQKQLLL